MIEVSLCIKIEYGQISLSNVTQALIEVNLCTIFEFL